MKKIIVTVIAAAAVLSACGEAIGGSPETPMYVECVPR